MKIKHMSMDVTKTTSAHNAQMRANIVLINFIKLILGYYNIGYPS